MGYQWIVADDALLVELIAKLLAGRSTHVARVLRSIPNTSVTIPTQIRDRWIRTLRSPTVRSPESYHRDGLLFQLISWIAAYKTYSYESLIRPPHTIMAHKGLDNLILAPATTDAQASPSASDLRIIVCEDKATENPRDTIRDEVWRSFKDFELGAHDHEMIPDIALLLGDVQADNTDARIDTLFSHQKHYRVALALDADPTPNIFAGFEITVPGPGTDRRRAEYLRTPRPLRDWMQELSLTIADHRERRARDDNV